MVSSPASPTADMTVLSSTTLTFALIAILYLTFLYIQIKLYVAFILAAATIGPVVAVPVPLLENQSFKWTDIPRPPPCFESFEIPKQT